MNIQQMVLFVSLSLAMTGGALFFMRRRTASRTKKQQEEEVELFTAPCLETASTRDKRSAARRSGNPVQVYLAAPDDKNHPKRGWIYDRSIGGLGILTFDKVSEGAALAVLPV